jgi:hypothetical protein
MSAQTSLRCPRCGIENPFAAQFCMQCALPLEAVKQALAVPQATEKVVEFKIDEESARTKLMLWLQDSSFAPNDVATKIQDSLVKTTYAPIMECEFEIYTRWSGEYDEQHERIDVDNHWLSNEIFDGLSGGTSTKQAPTLRKVKCKVPHKHQGDHYVNHAVVFPVCEILSDQTWKGLSPFDWKEAIPLSPQIVGSASLEPLTIDCQKAGDIAMQMVDAAERKELVKTKLTERVLDLKIQVKRQSMITIYLPIWAWTFAFEGQSFQALMNGQTGKIIGSRPEDAGKQTLVVLAILAVIVVVILLLAHGSSS